MLVAASPCARRQRQREGRAISSRGGIGYGQTLHTLPSQRHGPRQRQRACAGADAFRHCIRGCRHRSHSHCSCSFHFCCAALFHVRGPCSRCSLHSQTRSSFMHYSIAHATKEALGAQFFHLAGTRVKSDLVVVVF